MKSLKECNGARTISHIRNYIRVSTIAVALTSAVTMLAWLGMMVAATGGTRRRNNRDNDNGLGVLMIVSLLALLLAPLLLQH